MILLPLAGFRWAPRIDGSLAAVADRVAVAIRTFFTIPALEAERCRILLECDPAFIPTASELAVLDLRSARADDRILVLAMVAKQYEATPPTTSRELVAVLANATLTMLDGRVHVPR